MQCCTLFPWFQFSSQDAFVSMQIPAIIYILTSKETIQTTYIILESVTETRAMVFEDVDEDFLKEAIKGLLLRIWDSSEETESATHLT